MGKRYSAMRVPGAGCLTLLASAMNHALETIELETLLKVNRIQDSVISMVLLDFIQHKSRASKRHSEGTSICKIEKETITNRTVGT